MNPAALDLLALLGGAPQSAGAVAPGGDAGVLFAQWLKAHLPAEGGAAGRDALPALAPADVRELLVRVEELGVDPGALPPAVADGAAPAHTHALAPELPATGAEEDLSASERGAEATGATSLAALLAAAQAPAPAPAGGPEAARAASDSAAAHARIGSEPHGGERRALSRAELAAARAAATRDSAPRAVAATDASDRRPAADALEARDGVGIARGAGAVGAGQTRSVGAETEVRARIAAGIGTDPAAPQAAESAGSAAQARGAARSGAGHESEARQRDHADALRHAGDSVAGHAHPLAAAAAPADGSVPNARPSAPSTQAPSGADLAAPAAAFAPGDAAHAGRDDPGRDGGRGEHGRFARAGSEPEPVARHAPEPIHLVAPPTHATEAAAQGSPAGAESPVGLAPASHAPAPHGAASGPVPLLDATPESMPRAVEWLAERGGGSARLRLDPPHLGEVELHVRLHGRRVEVFVTAHDEAARAALEGHRDLLADSLASRALRMEQFQVSADGGAGARSLAGDLFGQSGGDAREGDAPAAARSLPMGVRRGSAPVAAPIQSPAPRPSGAVDLRI